MKKSILLSPFVLCLILCASLPSNGQGFFRFNDNGWDFHVGLGVSNTNLSDRYNAFRLDRVVGNDLADTLNPNVNPNNPIAFPKPSSSLYQASLGGFGISSGIIYGAEVAYGMVLPTEASFPRIATQQGTQKSFTLKTSYYTTSVMVQAGIVVFRNSMFILYPYGGIGYGGSAVRMSSTYEGNKVYPIMTTSAEKDNKVLWNANMSYEFGIGFDVLFGKGSDGDAKGFKLGVRAGMFQQIPGYNVTSNGVKVKDDIKESGGPGSIYERPEFYRHITGNDNPITKEEDMYKKLGLTAPYVKLIIGVGSAKKKS